MKLNFSGYESHSVVVDWKPRTIILEDGFSFENLTLYNNCTRLMAYTYHVNCTILGGESYMGHENGVLLLGIPSGCSS